jgi:pantoate--beta-alanine ligase
LEVIRTIAATRAACDRARAEGRIVGFVPTMGAFHEGHRSLMRRAKDERDVTVVSIFVNPLQFGDAGDLETYPRAEEADLAVAEREGVDLVFAPSVDEMYPDGEPEVTVDPGPLGERLEGASRPGHFRGVATVVAKLFDTVGACSAYFGEKDAQQLAVIRRMVRDLSLPVDVRCGPVVREPDGLALSSRNRLLTPEQREAATCLFLALSEAAELARAGERDAGKLVAAMAREIGATPRARIDYVAVVDEDTFEEPSAIAGPARALVAARFGRVRLIDTLLLPTA